MYAASSITGSGIESFIRIESKMVRAGTRLLLILLDLLCWSHLRSRSMVFFMAPDNGFPAASMFWFPMFVNNPLSCIASENPPPVLLFAKNSPMLYDAPSCSRSSPLSIRTSPQLSQATSPEKTSVTRGPLWHLRWSQFLKMSSSGVGSTMSLFGLRFNYYLRMISHNGRRCRMGLTYQNGCKNTKGA